MDIILLQDENNLYISRLSFQSYYNRKIKSIFESLSLLTPYILFIYFKYINEKYTRNIFKRDNFLLQIHYQPRTNSFVSKQQLRKCEQLRENSLSLSPLKRALFVHVPRFSFRYIFVRIAASLPGGGGFVFFRVARVHHVIAIPIRYIPSPGNIAGISVCGG